MKKEMWGVWGPLHNVSATDSARQMFTLKTSVSEELRLPLPATVLGLATRFLAGEVGWP